MMGALLVRPDNSGRLRPPFLSKPAAWEWDLMLGSGPTYSRWAWRSSSPLGSDERDFSPAEAGLFRGSARRNEREAPLTRRQTEPSQPAPNFATDPGGVP